MTELSPTLLPTDDTGDMSSGTPLSRAFFEDWLDDINTLVHSTTNPTITPADIIDEVVVARNGETTLNDYLDTLVALIGAAGDTVDILADYGENVSAGNGIYLSAGLGGKTAGKWYKTDSANDYSSSAAQLTGFAPNAVLAGASGVARISGRITGLVGLVTGTAYYASNTPGGVTSTPPANGRLLGIADSTTSLAFPAHIPAASVTVPGVVTIGAQSFLGLKSFTSGLNSVGAPYFAPGTLALGAQDTTVGGVFHKGVTATPSSTGGVVSLTGDITVKGNALSADGKYAKFTVLIVSAANANNKRIRCYYGGNTIVDTGVFTGPGTAITIRIDVIVMRTGASAQKVQAFWGSGTVVGGAFGNQNNRTVLALDNTADQIFKCEADTAIANSDLVHDFTIGEFGG